MDIIGQFRKDVLRVLSSKVPKKLAQEGLERPPESIGSDLAYPCFVLAKKGKRNPAEIARELSGKLRPTGLVGEVNFYGPYINFYLDWKKAGCLLVKAILREAGRYGKAKPLRKRVMVEFAHPNTHKAFHIGHVRNICIGESLSRILEESGYKVVRANYQGDIGPHAAKCLWGFLNLHKGKAPKKEPGRWLGTVYRDASKRIARSKKAEKEMREINSMLYSRDNKLMPAWKKTRAWSLEYFDGIYKDFGAGFDRLYMESEVESDGLRISKALVKKGLAKVSDGAIIVNLEKMGLGVFVLVTKENTPLYHAKDLALAQLQVKEHKPEKIIHVVGSEQTFYFRQLFRLLEMMKWNSLRYKQEHTLVKMI